jgi:hypothetical protein
MTFKRSDRKYGFRTANTGLLAFIARYGTTLSTP